MNHQECSKKILEVLVNMAGDCNINLLFKKKEDSEYIFNFSKEFGAILTDGFQTYDIYEENDQRVVKNLNFFIEHGATSQIDLLGWNKEFKAVLMLKFFTISTDFVIQNYENMFSEVIFTDLLKITNKEINNSSHYNYKSNSSGALLCSIVESMPHEIFTKLIEKSFINSKTELKKIFYYIQSPEFVRLLSKSLNNQSKFLENNKELIAQLLYSSLNKFPDIKKEVASHHDFLHEYIIENEDFNFLNQEKSHLSVVKLEFDTKKIHQVLTMQNFTFDATKIFFENITRLMMDKLKSKGLKNYDMDKKNSTFNDYLYVLYLQFNSDSKIDSKIVENLFVNCIKESKGLKVVDTTDTQKLIPLVDKVLIEMFLPEKSKNKRGKIKI